jgi:hypothetical protein
MILLWEFIKLFGPMALFFAGLGVVWSFVENSAVTKSIPSKTRKTIGFIIIVILACLYFTYSGYEPNYPDVQW